MYIYYIYTQYVYEFTVNICIWSYIIVSNIVRVFCFEGMCILRNI